MIRALITDFSRVLLLPKDRSYSGSLNQLHKDLSVKDNYKLLDNFELDLKLLNYYISLKSKLDLYIFTSESIQDSPELTPFLAPVFKNIYSALKMGVDKKDISAYTKLIDEVGYSPKEIIYVDDNELNIDAAAKAGLQTILYKDTKSLIDKVKSKLDT